MCDVSGVACAGNGCDFGTCSKSMQGSSCVAGAAQVCDYGYAVTFNCREMMALCEENGGHARCDMPGACSSFDLDVNTCTGDTLSLCVGSQPIAYDCTRVGMVCLPGSAGVSARCDPGGTAPDASVEPPDAGSANKPDAGSKKRDAAEAPDADQPDV